MKSFKTLAIILVSALLLSLTVALFNFDNYYSGVSRFNGDNKIIRLLSDAVRDLHRENYEINNNMYFQYYHCVNVAICDWDDQNKGILSSIKMSDYEVKFEQLLDSSCKIGLMKYAVDRVYGNHLNLWNDKIGPKYLYNGGYLELRKRADAYNPGFP